MSQRKQWHNGKDAKATEMSTACDVDRQVAGIKPSAFTNGGGDHTAVVKCKDVSLPKRIAPFTMTNGGKNTAGVSKNRTPLEDETMWNQLPNQHTGLDMGIDSSTELSKPSCPVVLRRSDNRNGFANGRGSATTAISCNVVPESAVGSNEGHHKSSVEVTDLAKRQQQIERRVSHLLKRVRCVQILESNRLVSQELIRFVDDRHRNLEQVAKHIQGVSAAVETLNAEVLQSEDIRSLSTAALVSLVQRLQTAQCSTARAVPSSSGSTLDTDEKVGVKAVSSVIYKNLRHLKRTVDPDATDSSSGGESDNDSLVVTSSKTSIESKPPSLRLAENRAAVACRWTWMQAQIAELEFQIRQCSDYIKRARTIKETSLQLCTAEPAAGTGLGLYRKESYSSATVPEVGACVVDQRCANVNCGLPMSDQSDPCCRGDCPPCNEEDSAARCRPVGRSGSHPRIMRLPAASWHLSDRERCRGWTSCQCNGVALRPCLLCSTFVTATANGECTQQSRKEHLALLDHAYHSVLSFRRDVTLSSKCEGMLRKEDWSRRSSTNKNVKRTFKKKAQLVAPDGGSPVKKKLKSSMSSLILPSKQHGFPTTSRVCKATERKRKRRALEVLAKRGRSNSSSHSRQAAASPLPSADGMSLTQSAPAAMLRDARGIVRRRGESPYDINNIVIPYTMAAATRVERLQYKEIMTPKWREVEANAAAKSASLPEEEEVEDVSDEAMLARHARLENQEKKRYTVFKTAVRRSRQQSLRGDSDPSTPEPWSPDSNFTDTTNSLSQPPSATSPIACLPLDDGPQGDDSANPRPRCGSATLQRCARSRSDINEDTTSVSEEIVLPWPKRTFPLSDEDERLLHVGEVSNTSSAVGDIAKHPDCILAQPVVDQSLKWSVMPSESDVVEQEKAIVLKLARQ